MTLAESVADDTALPRFTVPTAARMWGREHAIAERDPRRAALMLVETAVWYAASILMAEAIDTWWAWTLAWISLVACMMRLDAVQHEGGHRSLFDNRFANDVVTTVAAGLTGMHGPAYRCYHLAHHAFTRQSGEPGDPEGFYDRNGTAPVQLGPVTVPARVVYILGVLTGGVITAGQLLIAAASTMLGRPPSYVRAAALERHLRKWGLAPVALWTGLTVGALTTGHGGELLKWWLVPMLLFLCGPFVFFALSEHYGAPADGPMIHSTGSVESNRLYRWISLSGNYHLAHHVFPNAMWWWLRTADDELQDDQTIHHDGYLRFHRQVWADMGR